MLSVSLLWAYDFNLIYFPGVSGNGYDDESVLEPSPAYGCTHWSIVYRNLAPFRVLHTELP